MLSIFLAQENLQPGFHFEKLPEATEGYSGSDLKNLCIAAAYRPVQELLEKETKVVQIEPSQEPKILMNGIVELGYRPDAFYTSEAIRTFEEAVTTFKVKTCCDRDDETEQPR